MAVNLDDYIEFPDGETAQAAPVRAAFTWLASTELGETLLRNALAVQGKKIPIEVTEDESTRFMSMENFCKLVINPFQQELVNLTSIDGTSFHPTLEQTLAHELTHAGQPDLLEYGSRVALTQMHLRDAFSAALPPEHQQAQVDLFQQMVLAKTRGEAHRLLKTLVDKFIYPATAEFTRQWLPHPENLEFIRLFEDPAVAVENQVAALLGTPLRAAYLEPDGVDEKFEKAMLMKTMAEHLGLDDKPVRAKPKQPGDADDWEKIIAEDRAYESLRRR